MSHILNYLVQVNLKIAITTILNKVSGIIKKYFIYKNSLCTEKIYKLIFLIQIYYKK